MNCAAGVEALVRARPVAHVVPGGRLVRPSEDRRDGRVLARMHYAVSGRSGPVLVGRGVVEAVEVDPAVVEAQAVAAAGGHGVQDAVEVEAVE